MGPKSSERLIIWFVMRLQSTVLARALGQIPNICVFFEPFYTAAAYGPERRFAGFTDEIPEEPEATYVSLQTMLQEAKTPILVKDCFSGMPRDCFTLLPRGYRNAFLIRDSLEICASIDRMNQFSPAKERGFSERRCQSCHRRWLLSLKRCGMIMFNCCKKQKNSAQSYD